MFNMCIYIYIHMLLFIFDYLPCIYIYIYIYIYTPTYTYFVRAAAIIDLLILSNSFGPSLGSCWVPEKIRKRAEGLNLKSESYFIRARIPQRHESDLRNLQGLNLELTHSYIGNWPYNTKEDDVVRLTARLSWGGAKSIVKRSLQKNRGHLVTTGSCKTNLETAFYPAAKTTSPKKTDIKPMLSSLSQ